MCYQKQRAVEIAPPNGCALCEKKESSIWYKKYRYGRKRYLCTCYQKRRRAMMLRERCALCEKKEVQPGKKTDTGERDICATCYQKRRAVEIAHRTGVLYARGRRVQNGKI